MTKFGQLDDCLKYLVVEEAKVPLTNDWEEEDIASYARYFEYRPERIKLLLARKRAAPRRTNDG